MPKRSLDIFSDAYWAELQTHYLEEFRQDKAVRYCLIKDEAVIAHINFSQIFRGGFQACFLGYGIDKDYQGENWMFQTLQKSIDYMFQEKKLHRIMANYVPCNQRSESLLLRLGFVREG